MPSANIGYFSHGTIVKFCILVSAIRMTFIDANKVFRNDTGIHVENEYT